MGSLILSCFPFPFPQRPFFLSRIEKFSLFKKKGAQATDEKFDENVAFDKDKFGQMFSLARYNYQQSLAINKSQMLSAVNKFNRLKASKRRTANNMFRVEEGKKLSKHELGDSTSASNRELHRTKSRKDVTVISNNASIAESEVSQTDCKDATAIHDVNMEHMSHNANDDNSAQSQKPDVSAVVHKSSLFLLRPPSNVKKITAQDMTERSDVLELKKLSAQAEVEDNMLLIDKPNQSSEDKF